ncbi:MAG: magnesium transporter [Planctomycetes bacterium]|nr:magnesium transporter [Planctomycetota bacterium]
MTQPETLKRLEVIIQELNEAQEPSEKLILSLQEFRDADLAEAFADLRRNLFLPVFTSLDDIRAAAILADMDDVFAIQILKDLEPERIASILNYLPPDEGADVLALSEEKEQPEILTHLNDDLAEEIRDLVTYAPESAGGIMTSYYISMLRSDLVRSALLSVKTSEEAETINYIYVADRAGHLEGVASVRDLLQAKLNQTLQEIMETDVISVPLDLDQEEVFRIANKYHLLSLPVLDENGLLKGIITFDDLMEVIEDESSEDMYRMAGEVTLHPTQQPIFRRILARFPWLMVTLGGTFLAAAIIRFFELVFKEGWEFANYNSFSEFVASSLTVVNADNRWSFLLCFLPMIGGMAGNVGLQSSTVMVRGFATGEVAPSSYLKILSKELMIAAIIGLFSGLIIGSLVFGLFESDAAMGFVIGLSLCSAIISAAILGTSTPFVCRALKVDPAYASGPLLTTMNDILGFLIFFGIAYLLLP